MNARVPEKQRDATGPRSSTRCWDPHGIVSPLSLVLNQQYLSAQVPLLLTTIRKLDFVHHRVAVLVTARNPSTTCRSSQFALPRAKTWQASRLDQRLFTARPPN